MDKLIKHQYQKLHRNKYRLVSQIQIEFPITENWFLKSKTKLKINEKLAIEIVVK